MQKDIFKHNILQWALAGPILILGFSSPTFAVNWSDVNLNGYFSFEYEKNISGDPEGDTNGSFDLDLLDLVFNIKLSDKMRIATDITWEHGAATEDSFGNVAIEYGFAEYRFSNLVKVRVGKMFTNFGIYNEIHTAKPATLSVKEPLSTNKNNKMGSDVRFYPRWNTGLAILGATSWNDHDIDYVVQLTNGEDEEYNPYEEDPNTSKALSGRTRINVSDSLQLGLSFHLDHINSAYDTSGDDPVLTGRAKLSSYGFHVEWEPKERLGVEFEYVTGSVNPDTSAKKTRNAYTLMLSYEVNDIVTGYWRTETLEPDTNIDNDGANLNVIGVNLLIDNNAYLKLEIDSMQSDSANGKFDGADFTEFKASLSIGF